MVSLVALLVALVVVAVLSLAVVAAATLSAIGAALGRSADELLARVEIASLVPSVGRLLRPQA